MATVLTEEQFGELLRTFGRTAFRLELQTAYDEPMERDTFARFQAGNPQPPTEVEGLRAWFEQVHYLTGHGRRIKRVRVHDEPPTDYQRWERWVQTWNDAAGETIRYLTRRQAHDIGLLPAAGNIDWWLLDDERLIRMTFNDRHYRTRTELTDDPNLVKQAQTWRDLAVRHGALTQTEGVVPA